MGFTEDPYHLPPDKFPLYTWELNETSTRWDYLRASPDESTRRIHWTIWSILLFFVSGIIFLVFFSVILSPIRRNSFNLYLVYLMVPDLVFSFGCMIMCILNATKGDYWSIPMCYAQSVIFIFGVAGNAWMNAVIAYKLYEMLSFSQDFRRFKPPTRKQVTQQALAVYAYALFVASWGVYDTDWWPHKSMIMNGNACVPVEYDTASTVFFWVVFTPAAIGLPMIYVCYVLFTVWRRGLMPPAGRRRTISIYFFRLAVVFALLWFPALFLLYMIGHVVPKWGGWSGGTWSHMQGAVSAIVSIMKPDIHQAVKDLRLNISRDVQEQAEQDTSDQLNRLPAITDAESTKSAQHESAFEPNATEEALGKKTGDEEGPVSLFGRTTTTSCIGNSTNDENVHQEQQVKDVDDDNRSCHSEQLVWDSEWE
ncbi:expressed unknown protein [Seminavis robusta]|uniref:G-protein coupled receptors family 1 profile domain-containing protein n=1 Tax=Seminavis robusta TaxID=568900 RepID=A0A9N8H4H3_9STRA|nr:expressed unknown protein [Seminavis robusta]|eukprot:Sro84_g044940.1 n/a (423) ;mRNA; r:82011-83464